VRYTRAGAGLLAGDPCRGVGDLDLDRVADPDRTYGDAAVGRRVVDRVLDQVEEDAPQLVGVAARGGEGGGELGRHGHGLGVGGRAHRLDRLVQQDVEPHLLMRLWSSGHATTATGALYRNVTIGELEDGEAVRVTDYWGEPTDTPQWRQPLTDRLDMPGDGIWPDAEHLGHY
jgi:hypothetical protein